MAGILGEDGPDLNPPPPNQGVIDWAQGQINNNLQEAGYGNDPNWLQNYSADPFLSRLTVGGMSGYYKLDPFQGAVPNIFTPQEVAQQAGVPSIGRGFLPSGGYGDVSYDIPNDLGGFFQAPIGGLPTLGQGLSTNNWRLLGRGPGWIMRNGELIDTTNSYTKFGFPVSGVFGSGPSFAEAGSQSYRPFVGPFNALSGRNEWGAKWWPGATQWTTGFQQAYTS